MEEVAEITAEVKNVPALRFPEFDGEWVKKKLGDITKINQGLQIAISERFIEQVNDSYFYITNEFLREGSQKKYFIKNPPASVLCIEEDLLMTRTGNTGLVVTGVNGAFHNNFFKIKYDDEQITRWFLYYFLTSHKTQGKILKLAGASTIPDLNHGDFYRVAIKYPIILEQQKIASFLTAVDDKIQQLTKKKALLEKYKKGVMQRLFKWSELGLGGLTDERISEGENGEAEILKSSNPKNPNSDRLRFKDDNGNNFPEWEVKILGEISKIRTGSSNREDSGLDGEYTFFDRSQDIRTSSIYLFDGEAIIIAGEGQEFIPKYFIGKFDLHQRTYSIMEFKLVLGKYLYYFIYYHRYYFISQAVGSTVKSLRLPMFQKMNISVPSLAEQTKITSFLTSIDKKLNYTSKQLDQARQFKKGLLQQLFV